MSEEYIGIMTGNSLDAADAVLTRFDGDKMTDVAAVTVPYPKFLTEGILSFRKKVAERNGAVGDLVTHLSFLSLVTSYTRLLTRTVEELLQQAGRRPEDIIAVGLHGQTCAHCPPSVAAKDDLPYTLQIAHPKLLARLTRIPVVYDFRSDDVFNGGEGAPFAPEHNRHTAVSCGFTTPSVFCNAGNTGNVAFTGVDGFAGGFDCGPFNHFTDLLMRTRKGLLCDKDGKTGLTGRVRPEIMDAFWERSCRTADGRNFYELPPPKSNDPQWYRLPDGLDAFAFEDIVRTTAYLGAYGIFYALTFLPETAPLPENFVLFGGGWKNPVARRGLEDLISGEGPVLPRHRERFAALRKRLSPAARIITTRDYDLRPEYTEARIFADAARCFVRGEPFTFPQTTGCFSPTVCGVYCLPDDKTYKITALTEKTPVARPLLYSRAAKLTALPV